MGVAFQSKSRHTRKDRSKTKVQTVKEMPSRSKPFIAWIGSDSDDLFNSGESFSFLCKWIDEEDLSSLVHAKVLVVSSVDILTLLKINIINTACEYGLPIIWIGEYILPSRREWNVDFCLDKMSSYEFWKFIWKRIK